MEYSSAEMVKSNIYILLIFYINFFHQLYNVCFIFYFQSCVLKVNTQCEACKVKVMQVLQKIRGIFLFIFITPSKYEIQNMICVLLLKL
jgi:hypothetical protein